MLGGARAAIANVAVMARLRSGTTTEQFVAAIEDGVLATREGAATDALVVFDSDLDSWRIAVLELMPRLLKRAESHFNALHLAERLGRLQLGALPAGVLTVVYEDDAGDFATVRISIAGGGTRQARIDVNDTELWKLLDGGGKLSQLVTSRVRVSGDVGYVLDLVRQLEI